MRSWWAIARATALEILSEPLSLLLLLTAQVLSTLAPAFHYHQFGEPTRMARDAGFSALLVFGALFTVFGIMKSIRRETESGTLEMALSHAVSRTGFFLSKVAGAAAAVAVFYFIGSAVMALVVEGARVGGMLAARTGDISRIFGPFLAAALTLTLLPYLLAAALNRFLRCRFVLSVFAIAAALSLLAFGFLGWFDRHLLLRYLPALIPQATVIACFLSAAAAFSVRFRANGALAALGIVVLALIPVIGNFYLADALSQNGIVSWGYSLKAILAGIPACAAFLGLGVHWFNNKNCS